jgi:hypothetical protein
MNALAKKSVVRGGTAGGMIDEEISGFRNDYDYCVADHACRPAFAGKTATTPGASIGCRSYIACVVGGVVVNGRAAYPCKNGGAKLITQCPRKNRH